jgi:hypothetical protein
MSNKIETLELEDIRTELAQHDLDSIYEDRSLFDIFMEGCNGWANQDMDTCIEAYLGMNYNDDEDFCDDEGGVVSKIFYVVDNDGCKFKVVASGVYDFTVEEEK